MKKIIGILTLLAIAFTDFVFILVSVGLEETVKMSVCIFLFIYIIVTCVKWIFE